MIRTTPFHERTSALNQTGLWSHWAGHLAANRYQVSDKFEYFAVRSAAGIFDSSPLFKYRIAGRDAERYLAGILARDIRACPPQHAQYTTWLDERGFVLEDGVIQRRGKDEYLLTAAEPNYAYLADRIGRMAVRVEEVSLEQGTIAVQGPRSRDLLSQLIPAVATVPFFGLTTGSIGGADVVVSRTGYTGDLGYEVWVEAARALAVWDALIEVGTPYGITPAGMLALDLARNEAGLLLIEVDYVSAHHALIDAQTSTPFELSLGWTVALDKDRFNGHDALVAERERGPAWRFMGLEVDWDSLERLYTDVGLPPKLPTTAWRASVPIYVGSIQVGYATSGCWSPLLKRYIALAHLEGAYSDPGTVVDMEVTVEHRRRHATATVRSLPFFNPDRKRA